jgi:hypothetical protein
MCFKTKYTTRHGQRKKNSTQQAYEISEIKKESGTSKA